MTDSQERATGSNSKSLRVAVIGGGITGLTAAFRLRELAAGREFPIEVTLLERGADLGGPLRTIRRDGYVIETGADSFLTEKPWAAELARRVGLQQDLVRTREEFRRTLVVRKGVLVEIPEGFSLLAPSRLGPVFRSRLFSLAGKVRIAFEPLIPRRRDESDESLASFVKRRLGREVLDRVAQPLAGGIYTADPNRLSIAATTPRFVEMERVHGSVIRGLRAAEQARAGAVRGTSGARWSLFQSLRDGMGSLPKALVDRLEGVVQFRTEVAIAEQTGAGWRLRFLNGTHLDADAVICAAPAYAAAGMLRKVAPGLSAHLGAIRYASAATVNLGFDERDFPSSPRSFGFVVPFVEKRKIIAGSFSSLKFEARAPAGKILARVFPGGVLQSEMTRLRDEELIAAARDEFASLLGVRAAPQIVEVMRWPDSMPQYEVGHLARMQEIEQIAAEIPRFKLAGAAYRGVGIPDCVHGGERAAEELFTEISRSS